MTVAQDQIDHAVETVTQRCIAMGCAVWRIAGQPLSLSPPTAPAGTAAWVSSDLMAQSALDMALHCSDTGETMPMEAFPGSWLIPLRLEVRHKNPLILVVLAPDSNPLHPADLKSSCTATGILLREKRSTLQPTTRPRPAPHDLQRMLQWMMDDLAQTSKDAKVINEFSETLIQSYEESNFLYRLARLLKWSASPAAAIEMSCRQMHEIMPFRWVVARFASDTSASELAGKLIISGQLPCSPTAFDHHTSTLMTGWSSDDWTSLLTPDNSELAVMTQGEIMAERITNDNRVVGLILAGNKHGNDSTVSSNEMQFFHAFADFLSVFHQNLSRFEEQKSLFLGTLQALAASIDAKDQYTCGHSERVALLGSQLAAAIGLDPHQVEQVRIAGLVHDVGKIGIAESVLSKPGKLTPAEYEQITRHPVIGHQILKDIPPLAEMLPGVLYHHERWDGRGYPEGLAGEDIPLYGRILACADTFDAMSSTRAYRPAMSRAMVLDEIRACAGSQFDPVMTETFTTLDFHPYDALVQRHNAAGSFAA